jgi:hypothetical protein
MPVTVEIIENGHIMSYAITNPWTMNEFTATYPDARAYLDRAPFRVHSLVRLERVGVRPPANVLRVREHPSFSNKNGGYVVFCGAPTLAKALTGTALQIAQFQRFRFVDTPDAGLQFLREIIAQEASSP